MDYRILTLSAKARNGIISREKALEEYRNTKPENKRLEDYVRKRLNLTNIEYKNLFNKKNKTWKNFKTYKKRFERLRFLFFIFAKANLIPMSFYTKYCFPIKSK